MMGEVFCVDLHVQIGAHHRRSGAECSHPCIGYRGRVADLGHHLVAVGPQGDASGAVVFEGDVDVGEGLTQRLHVEHRARRLLVDGGALGLQSLGCTGDHRRRGRVDRLDLVEHDLLVGERECDRKRDLQGVSCDVGRAGKERG